MSATNVFPRPAASLKRKLNDPTTSFGRVSSRKAVKHNEVDSPRGTANGKAASQPRTATVEDDVEDNENGNGDRDEDEQEAGPSLPPDDDVDEEPEDDEEGRFFGGGVSKEERDVLDYIEENDADGPEEEIDLAWLKRTALNFERKINKNAELRAKYEDDPMKFVSSEADLDTEIKGLSVLVEHPELYKDFVRSGCSDSLVGLLAHENTDIAIAACEVIAELTDEDSGVSAEDWSTLVKSMVKSDLAGLLVSNLGRLDESSETDSAGVYHVLSVMENLLSDPANAEKIGTEKKTLTWLLQRVKRPDESSPNKVGQNRQYAAEILVILSQNHASNVSNLIKLGAIDVFLQLLSTWRRRDPEKDSDEEEFAENLFDCLATLVQDAKGREQFIRDEGIELCLIMLKEGKFSKNGAFRVLDHAAGGVGGVGICERLVEAGGLKPVFTALMKSKKLEREAIEHLVGILSSMLRLLPPGSAERIRTLAKFVENDYEKCKRLLELRKGYLEKVTAVDKEIDQENRLLSRDEANGIESEQLSRRMDAGLFPLQSLDVIVAWLIAEDDGARKHLTSALGRQGSEGVAEVRKSLREQLDGIEVEETADTVSTKDMLEALLSCLPR